MDQELAMNTRPACAVAVNGVRGCQCSCRSVLRTYQGPPVLQTERYHAMAEERKRDKEHAKTRRDKMQTLKDIEARAEAENLPTDVKPSAAQLADAQTLRNEACPRASSAAKPACVGS